MRFNLTLTVVFVLSLFTIQAFAQENCTFPSYLEGPRDLIVSQDGQYIYVACNNNNDGYVIKISLDNFDSLRVAPVGYDPLRIDITPDGQYLYVTNTVNGYYYTKIDTEPFEKVLDIRGGTDPAGIDITGDGEIVLTTNHWSSYINVAYVDGDSTKTISGIGNGSYDVAINCDDTYAYISAFRSEKIYIVSLESFQKTDSIVFPDKVPWEMDLSPDCSELWVTSQCDYVFVISTISNEIIDSIFVDTIPNDVVLTRESNLALVTCSNNDTDIDSLFIINTIDREVIIVLPVGNNPRQIALHPNGNFAYISNEQSDCVTEIDLRQYINTLRNVFVDIKPGSCPNPLNINNPHYGDFRGTYNNDQTNSANQRPEGPINRKAVLPVALLGTADFDVNEIDPSTIMLEGVPATRWHYQDVSTPVGEDAEECACNEDGPDGFTDLTLKFDKAAIVNAIGEVVYGQTVVLTLTGELYDGTPIEGTDCVVIVGGGHFAQESDDNNADNASKSGNIPKDFALEQNYPNPFNPITEISFSLPEMCNVELVVYNITGQKVATLIDGQLDAGVHSTAWDASNVASGVYFYRLKAGEFADTKKMILLK